MSRHNLGGKNMNENNLNWFKDDKTWLRDLIISGEKRKQNKKDQAKEWSRYQQDMKARVSKGLEPININKWRKI
mgnify:CR=1 FL=1|tara:strand:- start:388 stop:609 length:222 start_codon:yes stop_codon:yes gene_type:complete